MADISTIWDPATSRGDWALPSPAFAVVRDAGGRAIIDANGWAITAGSAGAEPGAGLVSGRDLETAVLISLFTDAQAGPEDGLPEGEDPRGWWGDPTMGSKLWLRRRAKQTAATLTIVKADVVQALAWLITDGVAAAIAVTTEWTSSGLLGCRIVVRRSDGATTPLAYYWAWKDR